MLPNMMRPICAKAAAIMNEGIKNAAIADAATLGYESMGCLDQQVIRTPVDIKDFLTGDIVQHAQIKQGVYKTQDCSSHHRAPE